MAENKTPSPALPAATVIVLRDAESLPKGIEALLLRRNAKTAFHGGAWVFPGGHIDPEDHNPDAPDDMLAAARQAAVREAQEEAGLNLSTADLRYFSHWTAPLVRPKRFSTWFFVAQAGDENVQVDGTEISAHAWMRPHEALAARQAGELELPPPTFVSLTKPLRFRDRPGHACVCTRTRAGHLFSQARESRRRLLFVVPWRCRIRILGCRWAGKAAPVMDAQKRLAL